METGLLVARRRGEVLTWFERRRVGAGWRATVEGVPVESS